MVGVQVERVGAVATVILDRPEVKNAVHAEMWDELRTTFRALGYDPEVRVVVLTGAGGDFCSGADVSEIGRERHGPTRHVVQSMRNVGDACQALHDIPKPVIAKVRGVAVGAGANMAFGCDLVAASTTARFSEIFAKRALSVDFGGSWLLPRMVGLHKAKELVLLADVLSADEVAEIGLVNRVVPDDQLDALVADWAERLAAGPPIALGLSKALLNASFERTLPDALVDEARAQAINGASEDAKEAAAAWRERREARFQGR